MYDIFFISFNESNQEVNWQRVRELHSSAMRIHGVKGIDKVHVACNNLATTEWFWTVDGDNWLVEPLEWDITEDVDLLMFHAFDPITTVWTKLGGVKLWRTNSLINTTMDKGDFCLNATKSKLSPSKAFSFTNYNATPYEAWKTSFRHCVKLMSFIIKDRPLAKNVDFYLNHWKACKDLDNGTNNAIWSYRGYEDAAKYVEQNNHIPENIFMINNYQWLRDYFNKVHYEC